MKKEKFLIQMFSGGQCANGQHYMELKCIDQDGKPAIIVLPIEGECQHCDCCDDRETCEIMCAVGIDIGKVVEIRRPD
jgi:hypothetical protein